MNMLEIDQHEWRCYPEFRVGLVMWTGVKLTCTQTPMFFFECGPEQ